jgi:hypothetical protein
MPEENNKTSFLEDESLKRHPFRVPEGYFENFPGRLRQRIREEGEKHVPVFRLPGSTRIRIVAAAAVILLALIAYPVIRMTGLSKEQISEYPDLVVLEEMDLCDEDLYLMELIETGSTAADKEQMYLDQAMEHLALNDVDLDLISE